jgi:hypothetical protein
MKVVGRWRESENVEKLNHSLADKFFSFFAKTAREQAIMKMCLRFSLIAKKREIK